MGRHFRSSPGTDLEFASIIHEAIQVDPVITAMQDRVDRLARSVSPPPSTTLTPNDRRRAREITQRIELDNFIAKMESALCTQFHLDSVQPRQVGPLGGISDQFALHYDFDGKRFNVVINCYNAGDCGLAELDSYDDVSPGVKW